MSDEITPEQRARYQWLWDRQTEAYRGEPTGTWSQRWLPSWTRWGCKHEDVRCIHGDEIIARNFRRVKCRVCGRALKGDLPDMCWFTLTPHSTGDATTHRTGRQER